MRLRRSLGRNLEGPGGCIFPRARTGLGTDGLPEPLRGPRPLVVRRDGGDGDDVEGPRNRSRRRVIGRHHQGIG